MPKAPITNIIFGTMTLGYRGYGARVHDAPSADAMLGTFSEFGHDQIDTCADYGNGSCEQMLGDLRAAERFGIATRIHPQNFHGHEPENLKRVFKESLARLKTGKVRILYLVTRDSATPIESTLSAVQEIHDEGLFEEFGVSNFSAWQVAEASEGAVAFLREFYSQTVLIRRTDCPVTNCSIWPDDWTWHTTQHMSLQRSAPRRSHA